MDLPRPPQPLVSQEAMYGARTSLVELGRDRDDTLHRGEIRPLQGTRLIPAGNEQLEGSSVAPEGGRCVGAPHAEDRREPTDGRVVDREMPRNPGEVRGNFVGEQVGAVEG